MTKADHEAIRELIAEVTDATALRDLAAFATTCANTLDPLPPSAAVAIPETNAPVADPRERRWREQPIIGYFTVGNIRPRYLVGKVLPVRKVNDTTYGVEFPDTPEFRAWRGRWGCRISKNAGTFQGVSA